LVGQFCETQVCKRLQREQFPPSTLKHFFWLFGALAFIALVAGLQINAEDPSSAQ
jgi:hypothetical protein